ncbi:MAG: hypothetical protein V7719_09720 [Psychroserpens sp.]|uniref:hypothetical protein n=1 Tax=Psychroserpens sp. TaxID=2020870 RepID=UPI0030026A16
MTHIEFIYDSVLLKGLILKRERFYIEVQLISPFEAWENYTMISGRCRMTPNHLLTERGDETIRRLLIESYKKFKILYESFDRISTDYTNYKAELISVNEISDIEIRSNIKKKLEDWFFNALFTSSITGVIATNSDRAHIFELLENNVIERDLRRYRRTKDPIYEYLRIV